MTNVQTNNYGEAPIFYPIPATYINQIKNQQANFSLCFNRMVSWKCNDSSVKKDETNADSLAGIAIQHIAFAENDLKKIQERQKSYIREMESTKTQTIEIYAETISPFISGLGSGHPTETGMILDRNTGVPYLPASSVKGVLRLAHAVNIANGRVEVPSEELNTYFGSMDETKAKQGQIIFLDAYPVVPPVIKIDIMNPHFPEYYKGKNNMPLEKENPTPVKFLSVVENTVFCFRCVFFSLKDTPIIPKDKQVIYKAFETAFTTIGFGGKTSIGYGRFKIITEEESQNIIMKSSNKKQINGSTFLKQNPKNGEKYSVRLLDQNKKGTWKVEMCDFAGFSGSISNSSMMSGKKIGDIVTVKLTSAKDENSIFLYIQ